MSETKSKIRFSQVNDLELRVKTNPVSFNLTLINMKKQVTGCPVSKKSRFGLIPDKTGLDGAIRSKLMRIELSNRE